MKKNPYNIIFGKEPPEVVSRVAQKMEILQAFGDEPPAQQMFMVSGVRGSGKTVFMTEVAGELARDPDWVVVELNSSGDIMKDLCEHLGSENSFAKIFKDASINLSLFGIGLEVKGSVPISNIQVALSRMLESLKKHNKKVLVCIDEVVVTDSMKVFAGAFQIFVRQDLPIYLIMTGLYENINNLQNEKNLTFLYRAPKINLKPLNLKMIADSYQRNFDLDYKESEQMAIITKGYSFAFQVLGYFTWMNKGDYTKALSDVRLYLDDYVYDKVWSELSSKDKKFLNAVVLSEDGKAKNVKSEGGFSDGEYSVYRDRLIKRGIINGDEHGLVCLTLPMFDEYIKSHYFSDI
ncbi:MAG: ATP-binding protein [Lachnospiraceae bacterium]|nr:ATP-binding protein [Lachnospiraceae bacterium]